MKDFDNIPAMMADIGVRAKAASRTLSFATAEKKREALLAAATAVHDRQADIIAANLRDLEFGRDKGLSHEDLDQSLADEVADALGMLLVFAHQHELDLAASIARKWRFDCNDLTSPTSV